MNRYTSLESHHDLGLGADELDTHRFTRPCERIAPTVPSVAIGESPSGPADVDDEDRLDLRVRVGMLTRAADLLHEVLLETPRADQYRDRLRDLALASKDLADDVARKTKAPSTSTAKHQVEGINTSTHERETDA